MGKSNHLKITRSKVKIFKECIIKNGKDDKNGGKFQKVCCDLPQAINTVFKVYLVTYVPRTLTKVRYCKNASINIHMNDDKIK